VAVKQEYPDFIRASTGMCQSNEEMTQNMQRVLDYLEHNIMHVCGRKWMF